LQYYSIWFAFAKPYTHKICINTYLPLLHREHSIIVNSVARVAVVKVAAARVAEVVKEVGVAGPHRHHLEMDALIGKTVSIGDQESTS